MDLHDLEINETLSQEILIKAKAFYELRVAANQEGLDRVNAEFVTATGDRKKFLVKSKAGYEAKVAEAQAKLDTINSLLE